jgi:hypothetical protein
MSTDTSSSQKINSLVDRIRKLLALAGNNPSEREAAMAMERASALMAEHNLTMAQVETLGTDDERIEDQFIGEHKRQPWVRSIWDAVAELNFCFFVYRVYDEQYFLIGARANVETTKIMVAYLVQTVERLARELGEGRAFRTGCADRLVRRLIALRLQRMQAAATSQSASTGTKLPALADVYQRHGDANRDLYLKIHKHMPRGARQQSCISATNFGAYERGYEAGGNIGLATQVAGRGTLSLPKANR